MSKRIVLGVFPDEAAADAAAKTLKEWDDLDDDVRVSSIGVLVLDDEGKVKADKLGRRSWGKGAGIGVALAALTPPGLIAGVFAGGVLGGLHHKGLGIDEAQRDQIAGELRDGRAAVGALVEESQVTAVTLKLTELGAELHVLTPSDEAVAEVDAAAADVEAEEKAAGDTAS